ncbi:MAG TPA: hypothetical protein VKQ30_20865 [Ktedonobacterales bacterium]|nr:hypothetical protein [Ktedonobacterales bacterium]
MKPATKAPPLPEDPTVIIPRAARDAAARADQLMKELNQAPPQDPPANDPPPQDPPQDPAPQDPPQDPQVTSPGNNAPAADDWKHKYDSLKPRFDQLNNANRQLASEVTDMRRLIETLQSQHTQRPQPTSDDLEVTITPEEEADFGPEFMSIVERKAKQIVAPKLRELQRKIDSFGQENSKSARERMIETMNNRVPNWVQTNSNPDFIAWLQYRDVLSGQKRHDMLMNAFNGNDAARMAAFFEAFAAENPTADDAPQGGQQPTEPGSRPGPKVQLETLAAPGRARSSSTPQAPADKPFIKRSDIIEFYKDRANGRFRGREEEAAKFERQIFEAQKEGRIR